MINLEYEMTFTERIEGPLGPTIGTPPRAWLRRASTGSGWNPTARAARTSGPSS